MINGNASPVHLEIQKHRSKPVGVLRTSYRQGDRVRHATVGRITGLDLERLRLIQAAFAGKVVPNNSPRAFQTARSRDYGAGYSLWSLARELGMDRLIYSRGEPWARDALGLVVSLALCAATGQRLETCNRTSAVWEICTGRKDLDIEVIFQGSTGRLLGRIPSIERSLAQMHPREDCMVCCFPSDEAIRPGFTEGLADHFGGGFGGRDSPDHPAEVIFCTQDGCPVGAGAFPLKHDAGWPFGGSSGKTRDGSGNPGRAPADTSKPGLPSRCRAILPASESEIVRLLRSGLMQPSHFESKSVVEVLDPQNTMFRYVVCPLAEIDADKSSMPRRPPPAARPPADPAGGLADIVRIIQNGALRTHSVLKTDIESRRMSAEEVVRLHRELDVTMKAWSRLKSVPLEGLLRYHSWEDARRLQLFLCGLASHLQWNMRARLRRLNGFGETSRVESEEAFALELLRGIRCQEVRIDGVRFEQITAPDPDQTAILEALGVKLEVSSRNMG